jgi:cytochrome c
LGVNRNQGSLAGLIALAVGVLVAVIFSSARASNDTGKDLFERRCSGCHATDRDKEGPRLRGVYGRHSGSVSSFSYSDPLRKAEITWDTDTLDQWLTDTEKLVPGNDMAFRVVNPAERREIIRYLQQLSSN